MKTENTTNLHPEDIRPGVYLIAPDGVVFKVHGIEQADIAPPDWDVHNDFEIYPLSECSGIPLTLNVILQCTNINDFDWIKITVFEEDDCVEIEHDGIRLTDQCTELHKLQNLIRAIEGTDLTINAAQLAEAVKIKNEKR